MNSKFIKVSLILISASALSVASFGQSESAAGEQAADQDNPAMAAAPEGAEAQAGAQESKGEDAMAAAPAQEGCPAGGCPTGGCPTGGCEVAPKPDEVKDVQLPDQIINDAVVVTPTGEVQENTVTTRRHQNFIHNQPAETHHTVTQHTTFKDEYYRTDIYRPTHKRKVFLVETACDAAEVMPCKEVREPVADLGCEAPAPAPAPCPSGCPIQ